MKNALEQRVVALQHRLDLLRAQKREIEDDLLVVMAEEEKCQQLLAATTVALEGWDYMSPPAISPETQAAVSSFAKEMLKKPAFNESPISIDAFAAKMEVSAGKADTSGTYQGQVQGAPEAPKRAPDISKACSIGEAAGLLAKASDKKNPVTVNTVIEEIRKKTNLCRGLADSVCKNRVYATMNRLHGNGDLRQTEKNGYRAWYNAV